MEAANPNVRGKWFLLYLACAVMTACVQGENTVTTTTVPIVPTITDIVPATGLIDGGYKVEILGTLFDDPYDDLTVTFGGETFRPDEISSQKLVVTVPEVQDAGPVSISVDTIYGTVTREEGFTYEVPEDRWGAYVEIVRWDFINPEQFQGAAVDVTDAYATFIEPIDRPLIELESPPDSCQFNPGPVPGSVVPVPLDVGTSVYLSSGTAGLTLAKDGYGSYAIIDAPESSYVNSSAYDVTAQGGGGLDTFSVAGVLETLPDRINVTSPDLGFFDATNDTGQYIDEVISCEVVDDGSFTIPASEMQKLVQTDALVIYVGRGTYQDFEFAPTSTHAQSLAWEVQIGVMQFPP